MILSNSQSMILLVGKMLVGSGATPLEALGAVVAFAGAYLYSKDSAEGQDASGAMALWGDGLALLSAISGVAYLVSARVVRSEMALPVFMFCVTLLGSIVSLFFAVIAGETITMDADINQYVKDGGLFNSRRNADVRSQWNFWMAPSDGRPTPSRDCHGRGLQLDGRHGIW